MARIGFIGTGEITAAMVRGLTGQGHEILVSERNAKTAAALADAFSDVQVAGNLAVRFPSSGAHPSRNTTGSNPLAISATVSSPGRSTAGS